MILQIFILRDIKAVAFGRPFFETSKGVALRSIGDELKNPQSGIAKHPSDYELYHLGEYTDDTGTITCKEPEFIINLGDIAQ